MARIRTIKPEFWSDSKTGPLSDRATKLFLGMLNFADDYGVLQHDIPALKAKIFPYADGSSRDVVGTPLVDELIPKGLVVVLSVENKPFLWIRNFLKHQRVDKPGDPIIHHFNAEEAEKSLKNGVLLESSANVLGMVALEGKGKEGKGVEGKAIVGQGADPQDLFELWNQYAKESAGLVKARELNGKRISKCRIRLNERPLEEWGQVFSLCAKTPFLNGQNNNGWAASFDWIIANSDNAAKVLEGKYESKGGQNGNKSGYATPKQTTERILD